MTDHPTPSEPDPSGPSAPRPSDEEAWLSPPLAPSRRWVHWLLFGLTLASTLFMGLLESEGFYLAQAAPDSAAAVPPLATLASGIGFSLAIVGILFSHEMGHYLTAKRVGMEVSPPYFLPFPTAFGTLGAFIKMRMERHGTGALDFLKVAAYGPLAGFVVLIPLLFLGVALSVPIEALPSDEGIHLGEPLLMQFAIWALHGTLAEGYDLYVHPIAFAAWGGMLITAVNLFPVGQLDGGHILYCALGEKQSVVGPILFAGMVALTAFVFSGWVAMCILVWLFGIVHPPVSPDVPVGRRGATIIAACVVVFAVCFTPEPILGSWTVQDLFAE